MGWSQALTIRKALNEFKDKEIHLHLRRLFRAKGLLFGFGSDSIFLNHMGNIELRGLGAEVLYYKDFRINTDLKWKWSSREIQKCCGTISRNKMSDANTNQIKNFFSA